MMIGQKRLTMTRSEEWQRLSPEHARLIENLQNDPKIRLGEIATQLGLIAKVSTLPANISGEIRPDGNARSGFVIRINRHEAKARQRFSLAHEISHYLLHRDQIGDGLADDVLYRSKLSNRTEAEANRLAADIIMPWHIVRQEIEGKNIKDTEVIKDIASRLGVSKDALEIRLGIK